VPGITIFNSWPSMQHTVQVWLRKVVWQVLAKNYDLLHSISATAVPSVLENCKNRVGVVVCLERGADCLHMVQLTPLHPKTPSSLASFKSKLILLFWYWLPRQSWKRGR